MKRGYSCVAGAPARYLHARFCQYRRRHAPGGRGRPGRGRDGAHLEPERYDRKIQPCEPWLQAGADLCSTTVQVLRLRTKVPVQLPAWMVGGKGCVSLLKRRRFG
jgi:hypothetical protein